MNAKADNIKIRQGWVEEETLKVADELNLNSSDGFLYFSGSLVLSCNPDEIEQSDIVDGAEDKQIDLIHIEDDESKGCAFIALLQCKNTTGFSSTNLIQIKNGLDWIFERSKSEIQKIKNKPFKNKIDEIRDLRQKYGQSSLSISVFNITNGNASNLSDEYMQEKSHLIEKYANLGFGSFEFKELGAHELVELMNAENISARKVNVEMPVEYNVNKPSVIEFTQGETKSFVCTVKAKELAKISAAEPRDAIFDRNVRPYYGPKGAVNSDILKTCTTGESVRFWFLNNGITLVCDHVDFVSDPDNPKIKIKNAQIVNGCQTTVTLREAYEQGKLREDARVMLRIYETDNPTLVSQITLSTNNQNRITDRDLRANDSVQKDIENRMLSQYAHYYERKNKQFSRVKISDKSKIVHAPKAAQAYLSVVRFKPSNARGYMNAIWSEFYNEIFENVSVSDLLLSYKIHSYCNNQAILSKKNNVISEITREARVYGTYHIARIMGKMLVNDKWGNGNIKNIDFLIKDKKLNDRLSDAYKKSSELLVKIRKKDLKDHPSPALYFKNSTSQQRVNAAIATLQISNSQTKN